MLAREKRLLHPFHTTDPRPCRVERNRTLHQPHPYAFHMKSQSAKYKDDDYLERQGNNAMTEKEGDVHERVLHATYTLQIRQRSRPQIRRGHWWTSPAPPPPLPLIDTLGRSAEIHALLEFSTDTAHPVFALVGTEPVLGRALHHDAADLAADTEAVLTTLFEGVLGEIGAGRCGLGFAGRAVGGVPCVCGGVVGDVLAEALAGEGEHDEDEVDAEDPEAGDEGDAHDAAALEDCVSEAGGGGGGGLANGDGVLSCLDAIFGLGDDLDMRDIELGVGEAGVVGNSTCAWRVVRGFWVLGEHVEPGDAEEGCVEGVDDGVEGVDVCEDEGFEGSLEADVTVEIDGCEEDDGGVQVHGKLEARQMRAGQECEETIQARNFVDNL